MPTTYSRTRPGGDIEHDCLNAAKRSFGSSAGATRLDALQSVANPRLLTVMLNSLVHWRGSLDPSAQTAHNPSMEPTDSPSPSRDIAIPLDPRKAAHVFTDATPTDALRELEARRFVWIHAIERSISMLRVAVRARTWFLEAGPKWNPTNVGFPTPIDGANIMRGMAEMAVITFLTVFKSGRALDGDVAGNLVFEMKAFRAQCVAVAFPDAADRSAFDSLLNRLEYARDCLLAHADGAAQEMEFAGALTSFGRQDNGVSHEDVALLLECAVKLGEVVRTSRFA